MLSIGLRAPRRSGLRHAALTSRQRGIAELAAQGLSAPEIANALDISRRTVSTHMHRVLKATGLRSRTQLEAWIGSNPEPGYAGRGASELALPAAAAFASHTRGEW